MRQLDHAITDREYPAPVWSAGEAVQEQVQISAAKLQSGSYAAWMGLYAPVTQMRAVGEAGPGVVFENRAIVGVSVSSLILSSAAGILGAIAVRSCGVKRAAVCQRRRPERTAGY